MNDDDSYLHIDSEINVRTGRAAKDALSKENDTIYINGEKGIVCVTEERWQKAQATEKKHWMQLGVSVSNDRNREHFVHFDSYGVLNDRTFSSAIELGCGPFTNMRLIANCCEVQACTLLDPLAESYLVHPHCSYNRERLLLEETGLPSANIGSRLRSRLFGLPAWMGAGIWRLVLQRRLMIRRLLNCPIEHMPVDEQYDLVVLINVLEHCYNAEKVFEKILKISEKGAVLVFHDKCYDGKVVAESAKVSYDAAHPLRVDRNVVNTFLETHFTPLSMQTKDFQFKFQNTMVQSQGLYFIGVRN